MILVVLGTQDLAFKRIIKEVETLKIAGIINEKVIVQAGHTEYVSDVLEIFDFVNIDEFNKLVKESNMIVTHGGVGSILQGVINNKRILAVPRLKKYGEHCNNHQIEVCDEFSKQGYITVYHDGEDFKQSFLKARNFEAEKFKSNNEKFCAEIQKIIGDE